MDLTNESFYVGALTRIQRNMLALWVLFTAVALFIFHWRVALGFALGCAIGYLSFSWLKGTVNAVADRITESGHPESGAGVVIRFLLRYVLMGITAYVILTVSPASLNGLFAGLFLPVAAIACEAAYQAYAFLSRGI